MSTPPEDYPVKCPLGSSLDTECAHTKKMAHGLDLAKRLKEFADAVIAANAVLTAALSACNGAQACKQAAKSAHSDTVLAESMSYEIDIAILKAQYEASLLDCCKKNV